LGKGIPGLIQQMLKKNRNLTAIRQGGGEAASIVLKYAIPCLKLKQISYRSQLKLPLGVGELNMEKVAISNLHTKIRSC